MSILKSRMSAADTPVEIVSVASGTRVTFNLNCVNTHAENEAVVSVFMIPRADVSVTSVNITANGGSFVAVPDVTLAGGNGSGATARAVMAVDNIAISAAGSGYAVDEVVSVPGSDGDIAATITVTDVDGSGVIQAATLTTGGAYASLPSAPAATTTEGSGTGATFTLTFMLASVAVTEGGAGYSTAPEVSFSSGTATAKAVLGAAVETKNKIEHDTILKPSGVLYRTALICGPGDKCYVQASSDDVSINIWGVSALS
jgi:hypothetical protein